MAKILNWMTVQKTLKKKGLLVFRPWDLRQLFKVSKTAASFFVFRNTKKGLLTRLKKSQQGGLYALTDNMPNQYLIANSLYKPSYVSLDAALSFHEIIPETIYGITSITTQATRQFIVAHIKYNYFRMKKEAFIGYRLLKYQNTAIFMAEPEKALADYLYFVDLKKRSLQYERLDLGKISHSKLKRYLKLFGRPRMLKLMEKIYADFRKPQRIY